MPRSPTGPQKVRDIFVFGSLVCLTTLSSVISACNPQRSGEQKVSNEKTKAETTPSPPAELSPIAHVPVGEFLVGSRPGTPGRNPGLEPLEERRKLGPFRIDAYPYPGDPDEPPKLGATAHEAAALCAERNGRLCTELEWERACRGSAGSAYPGGDTPCKKGELCVSEFEVANMTTLLEWTASTFDDNSPLEGQTVVRGASGSLPADQRRCARRSGNEDFEQVGFRCCYGAPNAAHLSEPKLGAPYQRTELSVDELRKLLASDERTASLAATARFFDPEAAQTVLARGPGDTMGFTLTTSPVLWQPTRGSRLLVVAGRSEGRRSFVVAYHVGRDQKILAGSFLMENEPGPIVLAYAASIRPRIHFSGCWGCVGETGKVLFREPEDVVLLQP